VNMKVHHDFDFFYLHIYSQMLGRYSLQHKV
jgi:hypothetical protein